MEAESRLAANRVTSIRSFVCMLILRFILHGHSLGCPVPWLLLAFRFLTVGIGTAVSSLTFPNSSGYSSYMSGAFCMGTNLPFDPGPGHGRKASFFWVPGY